ncbi:hypothetical protein HYFRA_00000498 [Hymenoscyphus fraxineus]|uniref:Uncharacterized protein n=1 Tax=Hymenoscyphus fraxineus TaxID=746836 RepID=A0A9N9L2Y1_9HELO|nr:hypothetical protein HYFRA_00000498 [Hymenoscyphus fraxineus]
MDSGAAGFYNDILSQWYARPGMVDIERGRPYGSTVLNTAGTAPAGSLATHSVRNPHRHRLSKSAPSPRHDEDEYTPRLRATRSDPIDVEACLRPGSCPYHPEVTKTPLYRVNHKGLGPEEEDIPGQEVDNPPFARWIMPIFGRPPRMPSTVSSLDENIKTKAKVRGKYYVCRRCMMYEFLCWTVFITLVVGFPAYMIYVMGAPSELMWGPPPARKPPSVAPGTNPITLFPFYRDPPGTKPRPGDNTHVSGDGGVDALGDDPEKLKTSEVLPRMARFLPGIHPYHGTIKEAQEVDEAEQGTVEILSRVPRGT